MPWSEFNWGGSQSLTCVVVKSWQNVYPSSPVSIAAMPQEPIKSTPPTNTMKVTAGFNSQLDVSSQQSSVVVLKVTPMMENKLSIGESLCGAEGE
jgi:hypothetical protein